MGLRRHSSEHIRQSAHVRCAATGVFPWEWEQQAREQQAQEQRRLKEQARLNARAQRSAQQEAQYNESVRQKRQWREQIKAELQQQAFEQEAWLQAQVPTPPTPRGRWPSAPRDARHHGEVNVQRAVLTRSVRPQSAAPLISASTGSAAGEAPRSFALRTKKQARTGWVGEHLVLPPADDDWDLALSHYCMQKQSRRYQPGSRHDLSRCNLQTEKLRFPPSVQGSRFTCSVPSHMHVW